MGKVVRGWAKRGDGKNKNGGAGKAVSARAGGKKKKDMAVEQVAGETHTKIPETSKILGAWRILGRLVKARKPSGGKDTPHQRRRPKKKGGHITKGRASQFEKKREQDLHQSDKERSTSACNAARKGKGKGVGYRISRRKKAGRRAGRNIGRKKR